jgi:hypothetical protein
MGEVVIHAGMPKAGSSSIQRWLKDARDDLDHAGWKVVVYRTDADGPEQGSLSVRRRGPVNSGGFTQTYRRSKDPAAVLATLIEGLDQLATEHHRVIISGEGFAQLFSEPDEPFLHQLRDLASHHDVRVAYYVRAQHESLEAAWRQWGFRHVWPPSEYIAVRQELLDYAATRQCVHELAPSITFGVQLFHRAAFATTSIVEDFSRSFLDVTDATSIPAIWANPGLPLELANALRAAPSGRFWTGLHDNANVAALKELTSGWTIEESPAIRRSRLIIQQHCHDRFEAGNQMLVHELAWPIESLVPPVDEPGFHYDGLAELDTLWGTGASAAELELVFLALEALLARGRTEHDRGGLASGEPGSRTDDNEEEHTRMADNQRAARDRRSELASSWLKELASSPVDSTPHLVRRADGRVFLIEAGTKRLVSSGLLAAALEEALGPCRDMAAGELESLDDGVAVEVFESRAKGSFVVVGGQVRRTRGLPSVYPADDEVITSMAAGRDIDVAHANVSRRRWREASSVRHQVDRLRSKVKRDGVVKTAGAVGRRGVRALRKSSGR